MRDTGKKRMKRRCESIPHPYCVLATSRGKWKNCTYLIIKVALKLIVLIVVVLKVVGYCNVGALIDFPQFDLLIFRYAFPHRRVGLGERHLVVHLTGRMLLLLLIAEKEREHIE
jgi:hypothetical protein